MIDCTDYNTLVKEGNIAFYKSCEVTQLYLHRKSDKVNFNLFTICVFEEIPFESQGVINLGRIPFNREFTICIQRYRLSIDESKETFNILRKENKWSFKDDKSLQFPQLEFLPKQYVPSIAGNRLNQILKNNFHSGSYIIELFDVEKSTINSILRVEVLKKFNEVSAKIKRKLPIDLSVARDRIGNFIYQFPITILEVNSQSKSTWDGIELNFAWHQSIVSPPECLILVESIMDRNYMGCKIEDYNKTDKQIITVGNLDQLTNIKVWLKESSLIIYTFTGTYFRNINFEAGIISHEPRLFEIEGMLKETQITAFGKQRNILPETKYTTFISNNLYDIDKKQLEKSLSFKQYRNADEHDSLNDLRKLIQQNDKNGVYLWDPFLRSQDILKTLYYSTTSNVSLRGIGSSNIRTKQIYCNIEKAVEDIVNIIDEQKLILDNPRHNNFGLNLEFRMQHSEFGWAFHDRFLIFPGNELYKPKVFSLGTSLNSYGQKHHILQEVSHPQPIVDAFDELWEKLGDPKCLVWKFPK